MLEIVGDALVCMVGALLYPFDAPAEADDTDPETAPNVGPVLIAVGKSRNNAGIDGEPWGPFLHIISNSAFIVGLLTDC